MTATSFPEIEHEILAEIRGRVDRPVLYDLGCGMNVAEGFVGVDAHAPGDGIEHVDLFQPSWPFPNETVDYFATSHFLEHVPDWELHFKEIYRTLKPGGFYRIIGPYAWSDRYLQDPTHKQPLLAARFAYLDQEWRRANGLEHYLAPVNFSVVWMGYVWNERFAHVAPEAQQFALTHYINAVDDIILILRKEPLLAVD